MGLDDELSQKNNREKKLEGVCMGGVVRSTVEESQLGPGFEGGVTPGNGGLVESFFNHAARVSWSTGQASLPRVEPSFAIS